MRRREFITLLAGAGIAAGAAVAQTRRPRLGMLMVGNEATPLVVERRAALAELGWIDGRTIDFVWRFADGHEDRLTALAVDLVSFEPDVILTHSNHGARAAARATRTIPVVVGAATEEVMIEIAGGLARPIGNVTGLTLVSHAQHAKCLELLKEVRGTAARFAVLVDRHGDFGAYLAALSSALAPLKVDLVRVDADEANLDAAFATMRAAHVDGVLITATPAFNTPTMHKKASKLALENRIPLVATFEEFAREGGLLALSTNYRSLIQRSATYVDKILKGAKPGELPVERPTVFTLTINFNAAKSLGITVPPSLLARADEVIE